jgi:hypothetical protein
MYSEVNSGANPAVQLQNLKLGSNQTASGIPSAATIPSIGIVKPNQGTNQVFIAFMDEGPGAADLPNTELGKNLKRIDPNHTPSEECDCDTSNEQDCNAYKNVLFDGITVGTSEELDALYEHLTPGVAAKDIGGGIRWINKTQWAQYYPRSLPSIPRSQMFLIHSELEPPESKMCAENLVSIDGIDGSSNFRLVCATEDDMRSIEHPGPVGDNYTLRDNLDVSANKDLRVILNPLGDFGSVQILQTAMPRYRNNSTSFFNFRWKLEWDRTVGTLKLTETLNGEAVTIGPWDGGPIVDINLNYFASLLYQSVGDLGSTTRTAGCVGTINGIDINMSKTVVDENEFYQNFKGSPISPNTHLGLFMSGDPNYKYNILAITVDPPSLDRIIPELERSFSGWTPPTTATPLTTEEIPDVPIGDPIGLTGDELVVNGYGMAPKLVANTDECEIPEQVVLYYALSLASRERGEVGGMAAAEIFALSKQYLADAIARDIGNSRHEYTWETV